MAWMASGEMEVMDAPDCGPCEARVEKLGEVVDPDVAAFV